MMCLFSSSNVLAAAIIFPSSAVADKYTISSDTYLTPFSSFLQRKYGDSINPYSLTLAYVAKDVIKPIEGPSAV